MKDRSTARKDGAPGGDERPTPDSRDSLAAAFKELAPAAVKGGAAAPVRVLIVDDEEPVRNFVDRVLRDAGYDTTVAPGGSEALEAAAAGTFDLVVTDVMMPQMNGDELARRLRQNDPAVKVLYLTGFADRLFKDKLTLWEGEAFLDKPCSVKGLQQAVSLLASGTLRRRDP
jgi:two-component system cell cycle sensor histidine kinase/response regulator CckA